MRKVSAWVAPVLAAALAATAACEPRATTTPDSPTEQLAKLFDTPPASQPFAQALPGGELPALDFVGVVSPERRWEVYVHSVTGSEILMPRPWYVQLGGKFQTTCPERNRTGNFEGDKSTVVDGRASSPFLCPFDEPRAKDAPGRYYVPVEGLVASGLEALNRGWKADQVTQALFVWLAAQWADAYFPAIYDYGMKKGIFDLPDPTKRDDRFVAGLTFGYCVAGTFAKAAQLTLAVEDTLMIMWGGDDSLAPRSTFRQAIAVGFDTGRPGDCIRHYWRKV